MRRREFLLGMVTLFACTSALRANSFQKVGFFMHLPEGDAEGHVRYSAFVKELAQLSKSSGLNIDVQAVWPASDFDSFEQDAHKLIALAPDIIVASTSRAMMALKEADTHLPIVFVNVVDPMGAGFVESIAHPGKNVTGFTLFEYSIAPKWLELLNELVPGRKRVAVLADFTNPSGENQFAAIKQASAKFGAELVSISSHSAGDIEHGIQDFVDRSGQALIITASSSQSIYRDTIIKAADRFKLPAIYPLSYYTSYGGLAAYGPDRLDQYRRAAGYVLRIIQGERPGDLPVQAPTKFELALNLRTAKALGLTIPPNLLARSQEVIE